MELEEEADDLELDEEDSVLTGTDLASSTSTSRIRASLAFSMLGFFINIVLLYLKNLVIESK